MRRITRMLAAVVASAFLATIAVILPLPGNATSAQAVTASDWDPGFIISDDLFYDGGAMSTKEVQAFLDRKLEERGGCQPWHPATPDQPQPPYTCLKDYKQDVPSMPANEHCAAFKGGKGFSAAKIIAEVGKACSISQKALLVLLQKEQSLVTDVWPWPRQYEKATGFGCPDTAPCDPKYSGFFYQVYYAAKKFQRYKEWQINWPVDRGDYNFRKGVESMIQYNPNPGCGAAPVTPRNYATASLYIYTPYQPNASALANMYGSGDGCGAYGNRNFWRLWWDWFGDPRGGDLSFVNALFNDMLGYLPNEENLHKWNRKLADGASPVDLANEILFGKKYREKRITEAYESVLGRPPGKNEPGFRYWVDVTGWGGLPIDEVQHYFLASDENYKRLDSSPKKFVKEMYRQLLNRDPSSKDLDYWSKVVKDHGTLTVVWSMYRSTESGKLRVNAMYEALLGRKPSKDDRLYWGPRVIEHGDNIIRAYLIGSDEYRRRAAERFPTE